MFTDYSGKVRLEITETEFDVIKFMIEERLNNHKNGTTMLGENLLTLMNSLQEKISDNSKDISWSYVV